MWIAFSGYWKMWIWVNRKIIDFIGSEFVVFRVVSLGNVDVILKKRGTSAMKNPLGCNEMH